MDLKDVIIEARNICQKLKASGVPNEANTKALVIEPLLSALGWNTTNFDVVDREVKVYDGTFLDYGLNVDGNPRLYVEAKALGENLTDKRFVAQTINYANNDGVVWCVLTDGITWRVFKTNESAVMDKKLLFEVDIADESQSFSDMEGMFRLISYRSVVDGTLDNYGELVFTDSRVRAALAALAVDLPAALVDVLNAQLGPPTVPFGALKRSLSRILDGDAVPAGKRAGSGAQSKPKSSAGPPQPPLPAKGREFSLEHHLANKSAVIDELFNEVDGFGAALGPDVSRRIRKQYIGYFRGKRSFFTVELQKQRVLVYLNLSTETARPWDGNAMRDVTNIGHFGMGNIEFSLTSIDQISAVSALVKIAYETSRKSPRSLNRRRVWPRRVESLRPLGKAGRRRLRAGSGGRPWR